MVTSDTTIIETQFGNLSILQSMYPLPTELTLAPSTIQAVEKFTNKPTSEVDVDSFEMILRIEEDGRQLEVLIILPLKQETVSMSVKQPSWLSRVDYDTLRLLQSYQPDSEIIDHILENIEIIQNRLIELATKSHASSSRPSSPCSQSPNDESKLERVWFWFPSLSSKEKRRDLVEFGEEHGLTGFVLAGKPGLLCVEGDGRQVDKYMSRIKSESWRDIPPAHKKVTERLRRTLDSNSGRHFESLTDITDQIPKYGQYAHRGEMSEVKRLMDEWGVGEDFGVVVMNTGT